MDFAKRSLFFCFTVLFFVSSCNGIGEWLGWGTWQDIKKTGAAVAACVGGFVKAYGVAHPYVAGMATVGAPYIVGAVTLGGLGYTGYRIYRKDIADRAALAAAESARRIAEEAAKARLKRKADKARVALEIMQQNAKLKRGIAITATVAGVCYGGYRLYRSIQYYRQREKQERDLSVAGRTLLDAIIKNKQHEFGQFGVPEGCQLEASVLLALPGGEQCLKGIVDALHRPLDRAVISS